MSERGASIPHADSRAFLTSRFELSNTQLAEVDFVVLVQASLSEFVVAATVPATNKLDILQPDTRVSPRLENLAASIVAL